MSTLLEILDPEFLSRNSVYISLLVGCVSPLVGVYLVLRRVVFLGVALPQVSSCGIAFAFALPSASAFPVAVPLTPPGPARPRAEPPAWTPPLPSPWAHT